MNQSEKNESEVSLKRLRGHHDSEWDEAYEQLWRVVWRSVKRKLPYDSPEQLEDLVSHVLVKEIVPQIISPTQQSFIEVKSFEEILNLASRVASNRSIDEIRRRIRRPETQNISSTPEIDLVPPPSEGNPHEEIHLAISSLDSRYRSVIEDFYFEDLNTEAIAEKQGRPKGSICSDLVKARQLLGSKLEASVINRPVKQ